MGGAPNWLRRLFPILLALTVLLIAIACDDDGDDGDGQVGETPQAETPTAPTATTAPAEPTPTPDTRPYEVGFSAGLEGVTAPTAQAVLDGINAYFEMVNQNGGVDGHPINLTVRDDGGTDTAKATSVFIEFRDRIKPSIVIGYTFGPFAEPIALLAEEAKLPIMVQGPTDTIVRNPYAYGVDFLFQQEAAVEVKKLAELAGGNPPKVAIFATESASGQQLGDELQRAVEEDLGGEVVHREHFPFNPPPDDFAPQAQRAVDAGAEFIIGGMFGDLPVSLMRSLDQQGWEGQVVNYRGGSDSATLEKIDDPAYWVVRSTPYSDSDSPGFQDLREWVAEVGGDPSGGRVPAGWIMGELVTRALEACGFPCPGEQMKEAMDNLGEIGDVGGVAEGPVGYTAANHQAINYGRTYHFVDGQVTGDPEPIDVESEFQVGG